MKFAFFLLLNFLGSLHGASIIEEGESDAWNSIEIDSLVSAAIKHNLAQEYDLTTSDRERDILSVIFRENVLVLSDTDFLIRLYETEMRGNQVLPGRKREIESALRRKMRTDNLQEITTALVYAHTNGFEHAFNLIIETISYRLNGVLDYIKELDQFSEDFIRDLNIYGAKFIKNSEYVLVTDSDLTVMTRPHISIEDFMDLNADARLPAVIRFVTEINVSDDEVTSFFIKNYVLNRFDLSTILILYQIEMMDAYHTHDTEGVIEKHLKHKVFVESNENMAKLALQMFVEGYDSALKLIIDEKFSFMSPFASPLWFKDLLWLFNFASENYFPEEFYAKVISLAKPCVVRRYVSRLGIEHIASLSKMKIMGDINFEDEDIKVVNFNLI